MVVNPGLFSEIGVKPKTYFDLAKLAEEGFPLESVEALKKDGLTYTEISNIIISPRTLKHRKARGEGLSREETERVMRVARVVAFADQVFGSHEKALRWLRAPSARLEGRSALLILTTEAGGREVENMLGQIDEGMFA
jgi:putative toxin-antitoxin system antitoxin component (TIGR02293 family)